jgi:alkylation response protein AidB-like acyl-CoA dehydrogenase
MAINPIVDSRDVRFILFEMLEIQNLTKFEKFSEFDRDTFEEVLTLAENIAVDKVYPINSASDKKGCTYDPATKQVTIPEEYRDGLNAYYEAGFMSMPVHPDLGGMGMPDVIYSTTTDFFSSASIAFSMYPMLSVGALNMIIHFMPESPEKKIIIEKVLSGEWGASMCLTEPDAGSDVGALKTKAVKNADGTYSIKGNKIFISSGDNNYYKNMIHPVLARIEGDPSGTKGISIFVVPKINFDKTGKLTTPNDVVCSGI